MITDAEFREQFVDEGCMQKFVDGRSEIVDDVDAIVSRRKVWNGKGGECLNQSSLDGWNIKEFAPGTIFSLSDGGGTGTDSNYCFRYTDIRKLIDSEINPYTGRHFTQSQLSQLTSLRPAIKDEHPSLPLSTQLRDLDVKGRCPLWRSSNPIILYSYVCDNERITTNETYNALLKSSPSITPASRPCIGTIYRIELTQAPRDRNHLLSDPKLVKSVEKVASSEIVESEPRPSQDEITYLSVSLFPGLKEYMSHDDRNIPASEVSQLYLKSDLRPTHPLKLYRGLSFSTNEKADEFLKKLHRDDLTIGDRFTYKSKKNADSWSTNVRLATAFAMHGASGIVLEYVAQPSEIIIDTRRLFNRKDFYPADQAEVILSGRRDPSTKYRREVKVYLITKSVNSHWEKSLKGVPLT